MKQQPFYNNPRFRWGVGTLALGLVLVYLWWGSLKSLAQPFLGAASGETPDFGGMLGAILSFGFAVFSVVVTRTLFARLVSQFALPVHTPEERRLAMEHFSLYASGLPGSAIFIRDGQLVASPSEKKQASRAAGVILVDSASGVVLRTDTQLTRACGPGVVFTRPGEYIAEVLDLRRQSRGLDGVKGLTRDGIELAVDIRVDFMLDSGERQPFRSVPDAGMPPYSFGEEHALQAVYGKTYRDKQLGEWAELPPLVAADVWRERLIHRDFESLFSTSETGMTLLDGLQYQVLSRLTGSGPDEGAREARVLAERGIRVLGVTLSNLVLPPEVEKKRLENWKADWKERAGKIAEDKDPVIKQWRRHGQIEGRLHVLSLLTQFTRDQLAEGKQPSGLEVVTSLTSGTRQLLNDPALQGLSTLPDLRSQIEGLEIWSRRLGSGRGTRPEAK